MDLSRFKWPIIIVIVVGLCWLMTSGGVNFMVNNFTKATPGIDEAQDKTDEAGLSRVGGYLLFTWQWGYAADVLDLAVQRYPEGLNYYRNLYRIGRCEERMGNYQGMYDILQDLIYDDAHSIDARVPHTENLRSQADTLKALHSLQ